LGSEIRYVQQPIEPSAEQHNKAVLAQWVGKIFFRFEENEHMDLKELIEAFHQTQQITREIMNQWNQETLTKMVEAPWRELFPYQNSVIHFIEHEMSHMGQIHFMLTYFRGPPKFESNWFDNKED
ncbi:MAG: DinB family protein, partial [Candidatus Kariarchaeaceae archaeon]